MAYVDRKGCIALSPSQHRAVIDRLSEIRDKRGLFDIVVEFDDLTVKAEGAIALGGYSEDDFLTGTGAWVETYRMAWVELTAYDEDGKAYFVDSDTEDAAYRLLNEK